MLKGYLPKLVGTQSKFAAAWRCGNSAPVSPPCAGHPKRVCWVRWRGHSLQAPQIGCEVVHWTGNKKDLKALKAPTRTKWITEVSTWIISLWYLWRAYHFQLHHQSLYRKLMGIAVQAHWSKLPMKWVLSSDLSHFYMFLMDRLNTIFITNRIIIWWCRCLVPSGTWDHPPKKQKKVSNDWWNNMSSTSSQLKINLGSCDESFPFFLLWLQWKSLPPHGNRTLQQPMMPYYAQSFQPHEYSRRNFLWV